MANKRNLRSKNTKLSSKKKRSYLEEWRVLKLFGLAPVKSKSSFSNNSPAQSKSSISSIDTGKNNSSNSNSSKITRHNDIFKTPSRLESVVNSCVFSTPLAITLTQSNKEESGINAISQSDLESSTIETEQRCATLGVITDTNSIESNLFVETPKTARVYCSPRTPVATPLQVSSSDLRPKSSSDLITGRRIVDITFFINELKNLYSHGPQFGCSFLNLKLVKETCRGLRSGFLFECDMCHLKQTIWSEPSSTVSQTMDVNSAAVAGVEGGSFGGGFCSLRKLTVALDIRCMNEKTFAKHELVVSDGWEKAALAEIKAAAQEEIKLARKRRDVDRYNVPLLTVVADSCWSKRSYRTNYNALSGVAAIVGYYTRKVLYFGVKNKYCVTCARASNNNRSVSSHQCFKNWTDSSYSMESAVIVEGFLQSEDMYGVKYATLIADGDSSVYCKIIESRPYLDFTVRKIECRNHLLRNYVNKLKEIATTTSKDLKS